MGGMSLFHWLIVMVIVLVLFGNRLPSAMRSLGRGVTEFKKGLEGGGDEDDDEVIEKPKKKKPSAEIEDEDDEAGKPKKKKFSAEAEGNGSAKSEKTEKETER